jgi:hypothetical protein
MLRLFNQVQQFACKPKNENAACLIRETIGGGVATQTEKT